MFIKLLSGHKIVAEVFLSVLLDPIMTSFSAILLLTFNLQRAPCSFRVCSRNIFRTWASDIGSIIVSRLDLLSQDFHPFYQLSQSTYCSVSLLRLVCAATLLLSSLNPKDFVLKVTTCQGLTYESALVPSGQTIVRSERHKEVAIKLLVL